jgi:hypothetical protein
LTPPINLIDICQSDDLLDAEAVLLDREASLDRVDAVL